MNIYEKLIAARLKFHESEIRKSGHNSFSNYYYFELADIVVPGMQILKEFGLLPLVTCTKEAAVLTLINVETPEERIVFSVPWGGAALKGTHEIQQIGAVVTYERRYLYALLWDLVEHDAIDSSPPVEAIPVEDGQPQRNLSKNEINETSKLAKFIEKKFVEGNEWGGFEAWEARDMDQDQTTAVWGLLSSGTRSRIKEMRALAEAGNQKPAGEPSNG